MGIWCVVDGPSAQDNGGMRWGVVGSPIGELGLAVDEVGVCAVRFRGADVEPAAPDPRLEAAAAQLAAWLARRGFGSSEAQPPGR